MLMFTWTVWWGAMLLLNRPMKAPRAPPTTKPIPDLKGQLSMTACMNDQSEDSVITIDQSEASILTIDQSEALPCQAASSHNLY